MDRQQFLEKINAIPFFDAHSHVDSRHVSARGLSDVLLYHMVITELYSSGCPDGARLSETPTREEMLERLDRAIDYVPNIVNTSCYWGMRTILKDLYGFDQPLTRDNYRYVDDLIRERSNDREWHREILRRAGIAKVMTEYDRRGTGDCDDVLEYSLEWSFFTRSQWGKFDAALLELEHAWNHEGPCAPIPVTATAADLAFARRLKTIDDVNDAIRHFVDKTPANVTTNASHLSTDITYRKVTDEEMIRALANRENAGEWERDVYANYIQQRYMDELDRRNSDIILQFSLGAEPLPFETGSILRSETGFEFARLMAEHPNRRFLFHVANEAANQQFCTIAREYPNVVLVGFWWHNFFPPIIRKVMADRLDMLPLNKQIGFFTDAYCAEWAYVKSRIVRKQYAEVLAQKVEMGQYDEDTALKIVRTICYDTPGELLGMKPANCLAH